MSAHGPSAQSITPARSPWKGKRGNFSLPMNHASATRDTSGLLPTSAPSRPGVARGGECGLPEGPDDALRGEAIPWLVIGMGSMAYGKERRAVTVLKHMPRIRPPFLTTIWEDGTVSELLRSNGFEFTPVSVGYLGRARLR